MSIENPEFIAQCGCFTDLFDQLGLPSEPQQIALFIMQHRPLCNNILLQNAPFWSESQKQFISEKRIRDEPPFNMLLDQLSNALRDCQSAH